MQELAREIVRIHDRQYLDTQLESLLITLHYPETCNRKYCIVPVASFPDPLRVWLRYIRKGASKDWVLRGSIDKLTSSLWGLAEMLLDMDIDPSNTDLAFLLDHLDGSKESAENVETYLDEWNNNDLDTDGEEDEIHVRVAAHNQLFFIGLELEAHLPTAFMLWHEKFYVPIFEFLNDVLSKTDTFRERLPAVVARFQIRVDL